MSFSSPRHIGAALLLVWSNPLVVAPSSVTPYSPYVVDNLTPEVRSKIMASVRQKNTGPEMTVRPMLHRIGYRYAFHRTSLPGRPDLVFVPRRKVVFVHRCVWHGHSTATGCALTRTCCAPHGRTRTVSREARRDPTTVSAAQ